MQDTQLKCPRCGSRVVAEVGRQAHYAGFSREPGEEPRGWNVAYMCECGLGVTVPQPAPPKRQEMHYRVDFDRPGVPNRNAIVPREIKRVAAAEPLGIFAEPAEDRLHVIVEAPDDPAAGQAALKLCEEAGYHYYPPGARQP